MRALNPALVFLGNRGGGLQLLVDTTQALTEAKQSHTLLLSKELAETGLVKVNDYTEVHYFGVPHSAAKLFAPKLIFVNFLEISRLILKSISIRNSIIVQIMPSPFDFILDRFIPRKSNKIVRCIHDAKPHLGEKWPTAGSLKRRITSADTIICFSNYVADQITIEKSRKLVASLPLRFHSTGSPGSEIQALSEKLRISGKPVILTIGRTMMYKGLDILNELDSINTEINLVVAGTGKEDINLPNCGILVDKWLTDAEFIYLIRSADILLFPYIEASQSGTIPIALAEGKVIVTSDVGGLPEQVKNYSSAYVYKSEDVESFIGAIDRALTQGKSEKSRKNETSNNNSSGNKSLSSLIELLSAKNT
jgi:glycosyltransferase involved in cell wall biosynthesis